jgi:hypothetical protein
MASIALPWAARQHRGHKLPRVLDPTRRCFMLEEWHSLLSAVPTRSEPAQWASVRPAARHCGTLERAVLGCCVDAKKKISLILTSH